VGRGDSESGTIYVLRSLSDHPFIAEHRFGHPVRPREWFLVPLHVIAEAVRRIRDGSITNVAYDAKNARLVEK
jgi:hypothetical protein